MNSKTLDLAIDLLSRQSVSPNDAGCQLLLGKRLQNIGFKVEHLPFADVSNLWAELGTGRPLIVFAGHTDVVPPGDNWLTDPFRPEIRDGFLYGRGAADMKGALAAMITAIEDYVASKPQMQGSIGVLLTSDEEADAVNGTTRVIQYLEEQGTHIDRCIIGEPSSTEFTGDTVRIGRRGSLHGHLIIKGLAGHVAYPDQSVNPIHLLPKLLERLVNTTWDQGNEHFPATSFQISNIHAGQGVTNVTPAQVDLLFNFRFCTASTSAELIEKTSQMIEQSELPHELNWTLSGEPFLTASSDLIDLTSTAISEVMGFRPVLSTSGGTSDGRFMAPYGTEVIELGPLNSTIHKENERVELTELDNLSRIYQRFLDLSMSPRD